MSHGKNFSGNNASGLRRKSDFYETPYSLTEHLLRVEPFRKDASVCEPACGDGAIVKVLRRHWSRGVVAYDAERDFLKDHRCYDYIITNPPFSLSLPFVKQAKRLARKKFALLLPLSYLHGKTRYDEVYQDTEFGLCRVHVFTRYPMLGLPLREDGKYPTGMMVYAWYVFRRGHSNPPAIHWIDNNADVLSKRDRRVQR